METSRFFRDGKFVTLMHAEDTISMKTVDGKSFIYVSLFLVRVTWRALCFLLVALARRVTLSNACHKFTRQNTVFLAYKGV